MEPIGGDLVAAAIDRVFRVAHGQAVATLVRAFGDITVAEDAVQDAFVVATDRWARDGIPANPAGWIVTTARNRAIDTLRRSARGRAILDQIGGETADPFDQLPEEASVVTDDQLRLIFTCCHPALRTEHQTALTLRLLGGLTVGEIARAYLVSEPAMAKRLVRAKYKISAAKIPYRIPTPQDLPERLGSVLSVLYLIYNAGFDNPQQASLRREALRLARALVKLLPAEPEAAGLLALIVLNDARMPARHAHGSLVRLADQDRSEWDQNLIAEGHAIVRECIERAQPGPYQLQAAIHAVHCSAMSFEDTDWPQIVELYGHLYALMPTPVVALNRAIAVSEVQGPAVALDLINQVAPQLDNYHLMHAARGAYLRERGQLEAAGAAFRRAMNLAETAAERSFLAAQMTALTEDGVD